MLTLYKDGVARSINEIDAGAWIKDGWSLKPGSGAKKAIPHARLNLEDAVTSSATVVDINTATEKQITELPGIGATRAKTIFDARPFEDINAAIAALPRIDWNSLKNKIQFSNQ